jgi:RHS repeat-associated protein
VGTAIISQTTTGSGAGTEYLMLDGHGSTRQLTAYTTSSGSNGLVVAREDYDGFGSTITLTGKPANLFNTVIEYTGQMWDARLLKYVLRSRMYDPGIGRFTSYDDADIQASDLVDANHYLYVGSSPIMFTDPNGHGEGNLAVTLVVVGIIGIVAGVTLQEIGLRTNSPTLQTIGSWTTTGGIFVSAALGPGVIKLAWNQTAGTAATIAGNVAKTESIADGLPRALRTVSGPVPIAGRIVQRPGQANWWQLGYLNTDGQPFTNKTIHLQTGDIIYDYGIDVMNEKAMIKINKMNSAGTFDHLGDFAVQSGDLGGLPYMNTPNGVSPLPNMQILGH